MTLDLIGKVAKAITLETGFRKAETAIALVYQDLWEQLDSNMGGDAIIELIDRKRREHPLRDTHRDIDP